MMIGTQLPTCTSHYNMLQYQDVMDFMIDFEDDPHATTHSMIGGTYGCDMLIPLLDEGLITDEDSLLAICSSWVFYLKEFYRANYLIPNSGCDASIPDEATCGYTCTDGITDDLKFSLKNKIETYIPDLDDDQWDTWISFICEGDGQKIFSGDQLESASPIDPSFWPIHTTLERLVHAKYMSGGFKINDWAFDPINDFVCSKAECYESDYGSTDYWADCCQGHYQFDQLFDAINGNRSQYFGPTNDDMLAATDPTSDAYSMPYIYDSFTWDHCDEDFEELLETLHTSTVVFTDVPEISDAPAVFSDTTPQVVVRTCLALLWLNTHPIFCSLSNSFLTIPPFHVMLMYLFFGRSEGWPTLPARR
jgi:hypothetical protein